MLDAFPLRMNEPELVGQIVSFTGNGAGAPTKRIGNGISIARTGVGAFTLTFADQQGAFCGLLSANFDATVPSTVAGFDVTAGVPAISALGVLTVPVVVTSSTFVPVDLTAAQSVTITMGFKREGLTL